MATEEINFKLVQNTDDLRTASRELKKFVSDASQLSQEIKKKGFGSPEDFQNISKLTAETNKYYQNLESKIKEMDRLRKQSMQKALDDPANEQKWMKQYRQADRFQNRYEAEQQKLIKSQKMLTVAGGAKAEGSDELSSMAGLAGLATGGVAGIITAGLGLIGIGKLTDSMKKTYNIAKELRIEGEKLSMQFISTTGSIDDMTSLLQISAKNAGYLAKESMQIASSFGSTGGAYALMKGSDGKSSSVGRVAEIARARGLDPIALAQQAGQMYRMNIGQDTLYGIEGARTTRTATIGGKTRIVSDDISYSELQRQAMAFGGRQSQFIEKPDVGGFLGMRKQFITSADTDTEREFRRRTFESIATSMDNAIRNPSSEASKFFVMQSLGLGSGASLYDVEKGMEGGLTSENAVSVLKRIREFAPDKEEFARTVKSMTGGSVGLNQAELLWDMEGGFGDKDADLDAVGKEIISMLGDKQAGGLPDVWRNIDLALENINKTIGDGLTKEIAPPLLTLAESAESAVVQMANWLGRGASPFALDNPIYPTYVQPSLRAPVNSGNKVIDEGAFPTGNPSD